jgi:hypothetical protein
MRFFLHYFVAAHSQMLMYVPYTLRFSNAPRLVLKKKSLLFMFEVN